MAPPARPPPPVWPGADATQILAQLQHLVRGVLRTTRLLAGPDSARIHDDLLQLQLQMAALADDVMVETLRRWNLLTPTQQAEARRQSIEGEKDRDVA